MKFFKHRKSLQEKYLDEKDRYHKWGMKFPETSFDLIFKLMSRLLEESKLDKKTSIEFVSGESMWFAIDFSFNKSVIISVTPIKKKYNINISFSDKKNTITIGVGKLKLDGDECGSSNV